ncbi:mechanosensitive ion channel family protein [bacterium]|nr:mechanosensitive ion channel family protein [bacterium]
MESIKEFFIEWKIPIIIALILVGTFFLMRLFNWIINRSIDSASEKLKVDLTRYKFFKNAFSFIIWLIALGVIVSLIPALKTFAVMLFAGAGIMMAVLGFAAQHAFSNIISGIFIVIFKPFRVGDLIKVGSINYGIVEDITLRHTVIRNFENKRIIIPNAVISAETIVNDTIEDSRICRWIEIGISYDSDVDHAIRIIQKEAMKHPDCIDVRTTAEKEAGAPQVLVRQIAFGDFSINLRAFVWTHSSIQAWQMHSDLNRSIKKRFDAEGIEIPFPYRTIVYKKDLPENRKVTESD